LISSNYLILIIFRSNKYVWTDAKEARIKPRRTLHKASVLVARLAPTSLTKTCLPVVELLNTDKRTDRHGENDSIILRTFVEIAPKNESGKIFLGELEQKNLSMMHS